jgi:hypothetical protein
MMEQWNSGIMGSGIMQCWINGPATDGIDDKIKMADILLKTNIPEFHNSIIPFSGQIRKPQKTSIFSVGYRNSETLN